MGRLSACAVEVMEAMERYLRNHHLARLYVSGDTLMKRLLEAVRNREVVYFNRNMLTRRRSELVNTFLLGMAADVTSNFAHFDISSLAAPSPMRIRRLCIANEFGNDSPSWRLNVSSLTTLETLEVRNHKITSPIILPSSVTRVSIERVGCRNPIREVEKLPLLHTLSLSLMSFGGFNAHQDFYDTLQWPPSLTSLEMDILFHSGMGLRLPKTLRRLAAPHCFDVHNQRPLDLASLIRDLPLLESLVIAEGRVTVSSPLSTSTLTELRLFALQVGRNDSLVEIVDRIPPSVTRLSVEAIVSGVPDMPLSMSDRKRALELMLPRMSFQDAQHLLDISGRDYYGMGGLGDHVVGYRERLLESHRLDVKYALAMTGTHASKRTAFRLEYIARLMDLGAPESVISHIIGERVVHEAPPKSGGQMSSSLGQSWWSDLSAQTSLRMVQEGYTRCLSVAACAVDALGSRPLPTSVTYNVTRLLVPSSSTVELDNLLAHSVLACVERVDLFVERSQELCQAVSIVEVLRRHKQSVPRLERLFLHGASAHWLWTSCGQMLAEMGLYEDAARNCMSYYVGRDASVVTDALGAIN